MEIDLQKALSNPIWLNHKVGDTYSMDKDPDKWKIAYYPLFGTYNNKVNSEGVVLEVRWEDFSEPRALIEKPIKGGIDFREVPLRYLTKFISPRNP